MELILFALVVGAIAFLVWRYRYDSFEPNEKYIRVPARYPLNRPRIEMFQFSNMPASQDIREAQQALDNKQLTEAARLAREILKQRPREIEALRILSVALLRLEQYEAARKVADMWLEIAPANGAAYNVRGVIHAKLDLEKLAFADYKEAVRLGSSEDEFAYVNLSIHYAAQGNVDEALKLIHRSLELPATDENRAKQYHQCIAIRLLMWDVAGAKADLEALTQLIISNIWQLKARLMIHFEERDYAAVIDNCTAALKLVDTRDTSPYAYRSRAYSRLQQWDAAHTDIDRGIELSQGRNRLRRLITKTYFYLRQGQFDQAYAIYDRIIREAPEYGEAYCERSEFYIYQGEYDKALADCQKALELKPDFYCTYLHLGQIYLLTGKLDDALASYHRALDIYPYLKMAHIGQAVTLFRQGRLTEVRSVWQRLTIADPALANVNTLNDDFHPAEPFVEAVRQMIAALEI